MASVLPEMAAEDRIGDDEAPIISSAAEGTLLESRDSTPQCIREKVKNLFHIEE
jgi:hypothetical protein